jgi:nucleotide-binding universal stress UspA family protein
VETGVLKNSTNKILLPLDGSEASYKAYLPAKSLSEYFKMKLHILHISDEKLANDLLIKKLRLNEDQLQEVVIDQKQGIPKEIILKESCRSSFIVIGSHGETGDMSKIVGSVAYYVLENCDNPVFLIKPDVHLNLKNGKWHPNILIPLNGQPDVTDALKPIIKLLSKVDANLFFLHISSLRNIENVKGSLTAPYYQDYQQYEWKSWSDEFIRRFSTTSDNPYKKQNIRIFLSKGNPADEILCFIDNNDIDFLVIVWHGTLQELRAKTLKKIIAKVKCPLLMTKIKPDQLNQQ